MKPFIVPKDAPTQKSPKHWQFCVGSGHAALALRTDYCQQLAWIQKELGFRRVRFHGIFNDDMHTMDTMDTTPIAADKRFAEHSFRYCALAYDNLLACGVKPLVELSFMPRALAKTEKTGFFYYKPVISQPRSDGEWAAYIQRFVRFLLNRYGKQEVEGWLFEVWNEPDLAVGFFEGTQQDYFRLYEVTARAIKEVDPALRVGGPSTSGSKWIKAFVEYCRGRDVPVDFVTTHQYAGDPLGGVQDQGGPDEDGGAHVEIHFDPASLLADLPDGPMLPAYLRIVTDNTETETTDRDIFAKHAAVVKAQAQGLPVYYTEWNACATFTAPGNDTRKVAAYDVRAALMTENVVDGSSIWCFSDIFEELHPFPEEFHGGFGLLTQHGIPKPVFYALKMLADAGEDRVALPGAMDGEISLAAFRKEGATQLLLTRQELHHFANADAAPLSVQVAVELPVAPREVTVRRVDADHGNPLAIWQAMGEPTDLTPAQVEDIRRRSEVKPEALPAVYRDRQMLVDAALGTNDVWFVEIR